MFFSFEYIVMVRTSQRHTISKGNIMNYDDNYEDDRYNDVCGETYDHTLEVTYEDDELLQWRCEECGAEGEEEY